MAKTRRSFLWHAGTFDIKLGAKTLVMGVVNVTPDSFSGDGVLSKYSRDKIKGLSHALKLADQGADILDIGGESSRPGAKSVTVDEESVRVVPLITTLVKHVKVPLSIDTYKPLVARRALEAGASIVNLIKGTPPDKSMIRTVAEFKAGLVLMHMRGTPVNMQSKTTYKDVLLEVKSEIRDAIDTCKLCGVEKESLVIDPGIGFAKTTEQNLLLINHLKQFASMGFPLLVGTSRKSFIGNVLQTGINERLYGTLASVVLAIAGGAHILRVHNVKEIKQAAAMADAIMAAG